MHAIVTSSCVSLPPRFQGKLILLNKVDNIEHVFTLKGNGQRPLPLETITITCRVKQSIQQVLEVTSHPADLVL